MLFAGSLVDRAVTLYAPPGCTIRDSKDMTLEEMTAWLQKALEYNLSLPPKAAKGTTKTTKSAASSKPATSKPASSKAASSKAASSKSSKAAASKPAPSKPARKR